MMNLNVPSAHAVSDALSRPAAGTTPLVLAREQPESVFANALPPDLVETLASLDPSQPRLAEVALGRLRPGSVQILQKYGICDFDERDGTQDVHVNDLLWTYVKLAQHRRDENLPTAPPIDDLRQLLASLTKEASEAEGEAAPG